MNKKDTAKDESKSSPEDANQRAIEEKVRNMLDPEVKDPVPTQPEVPASTTAPEVTEPDDGVEPPETPNIAEDSDEPPENYLQAPKDLAVNDTNTEVDAAVDDIVAKESDALLEAEDEKISESFQTKKPNVLSRFKEALVSLWRDRRKRHMMLGVGVVLLAIGFTVPHSRYFLLNTAGVRSSASFVIVDGSTQLPLKNVKVSLGRASAETDREGKVRLQDLRLGKNKLQIEKRAFSVLEKDIIIGWGSNPLGDVSLTPTGSQYSFVFSDYLSGKPVGKVEAVSGEANALSNDQGELKLTLDKDAVSELQEIEVIITAEGYREERVMLNLDNQAPTSIQLAPGRSHVFISKRSGKYDVYKIDADGKNEEKILPGTGTERDDMVLVPHPSEKLVALVSTRDNERNADGFLMSTLTIIDLQSHTPTKITTSERIQIVDWSDKRLVYVQIAAGASAADANRHRLMSYDLESGESKELASSNYFNDVFSIRSVIYYAPSSAYTSDKASLFKINADGGGRQTAFGEEVWNVFRTEYNKLVLAVAQEWYEYKISDGKTTKIGGEPASLYSRIYADNPDRDHSLWVDSRDGKGVLLNYDLTTNNDKILREQSGLTNPIRWLSNNAVVYRVSNAQETADYVMSLNGGEPKKLKDVTNTSGIDRWYYY